MVLNNTFGARFPEANFHCFLTDFINIWSFEKLCRGLYDKTNANLPAGIWGVMKQAKVEKKAGDRRAWVSSVLKREFLSLHSFIFYPGGGGETNRPQKKLK